MMWSELCMKEYYKYICMKSVDVYLYMLWTCFKMFHRLDFYVLRLFKWIQHHEHKNTLDHLNGIRCQCSEVNKLAMNCEHVQCSLWYMQVISTWIGCSIVFFGFFHFLFFSFVLLCRRELLFLQSSRINTHQIEEKKKHTMFLLLHFAWNGWRTMLIILSMNEKHFLNRFIVLRIQ